MAEMVVSFHNLGMERGALICKVAEGFSAKLKGLKDAETLNENEGMLFPFLFSFNRCFSMKGMKIPLDIIFIDKYHIVVKIISAGINTNKGIKGFCKYVVECNAGFCKAHSITAGNSVEIWKRK